MSEPDGESVAPVTVQKATPSCHPKGYGLSQVLDHTKDLFTTKEITIILRCQECGKRYFRIFEAVEFDNDKKEGGGGT